MVRDYLEHHDQANQNLTNELFDEIHRSLKEIFMKKRKKEKFVFIYGKIYQIKFSQGIMSILPFGYK
jgi:hypothetical protein